MDPSFSPTLVEHLDQSPPELLHHYTTQNGLIGIVENSVLWATKAHYMNDSTEFSIALKIAEQKIFEEFGVTKNSDGFFNNISAMPAEQQLAAEMYNVVHRIQNVHIAIACFCEDADLLSQWRGYTQNDYGYSIGFNSTQLQSKAKLPFTLGKCIYLESVQATIIEDLIKKIREKATNPLDGQDIMRSFSDALIKYGVYFKDSSFKEEKEWRLTSSRYDVTDLFFRPGKSMIIPYGHIPLGSGEESPIKQVLVGPCPHPDVSVQSVFALLMKADIGEGRFRGFAQPVVHKSKIPYRGW